MEAFVAPAGQLTIDAGGEDLRAELHLPAEQAGVVVLAGASASSDNGAIDALAARLREAGLGILRVQLLTDDEAAGLGAEGLRLTPEVLGGRLSAVVDWLNRDDRTAVLPIGVMGADASAASVLVAAANRPERVGAVVSILGRPDLAGDALERVGAPTLIVMGTREGLSVDGANEAARRLGAVSQVERIESAGDSVGLEAVDALASSAVDWFLTHLVTMESPTDAPEPGFYDTHVDRFPPQQGKPKPNA